MSLFPSIVERRIPQINLSAFSNLSPEFYLTLFLSESVGTANNALKLNVSNIEKKLK